MKALDSSEQEIGARIAAVGGSAETEAPGLPVRIVQVDHHAQEIAADRELVRAADPVKGVGEVIVLALEVARGAGADAEVPGDFEC